MKATGIVRRIDDLGRVVIPKEIRRTLRIRESDPLEIFTDREGEIILKKYSPIGEITPFAKKYAESMAQVSGLTAIVADRDQFIAVSGSYKELNGKHLSKELEEKMGNREIVMAKKGEKNFIPIADDFAGDYTQEAIAPIICEGDIIGAVGLLGNDQKTMMGDTEQKLIQAAAGFLGKQMEQ
ncbi:MAG: stage V sporulation protein T [Lachnospiraceae bacterium]|nr:stage V sporulation protein T [Lachnospiraceae bacterium]